MENMTLTIFDEDCQHKRKVYTDEELLNYLKGFYEKNKRIPVKRDFINNPEYPGHDTYNKRFGSWNKALILAGIDIDKKIIRRNKIYKNEELLNYLKDFYEKNKRIPTAYDIANNPEYPSIYIYTKNILGAGIAL